MRRHRQIALLGFPGVGKSSLAHHFVYKQFYNEYSPSIKTSKSILNKDFAFLFCFL
jgi:GTPase SAR1 family protein